MLRFYLEAVTVMVIVTKQTPRKGDNQMKVRHISSARLTVAVTETDDNQLAVGIAVASKKDQFTRKLGLAIATGRVEKNAFMVPFRPMTGLRFSDVLTDVSLQLDPRETAFKRAVDKAIEVLNALPDPSLVADSEATL